MVEDENVPQIVTKIEYGGATTLRVCTVLTAGSEAPIEVDVSPIEDQREEAVGDVPTTDDIALTPFETDVMFTCHSTNRRFTWTSGALYPSVGGSHRIEAGQSQQLRLDEVFHVTYNLRTNAIRVLAHNLYSISRHVLKDLGTVRLVSESGGGYRCEINLAGVLVTDTETLPYSHSGSSITTITEHDSLLTPQSQVPTLGNDPNFRASYNEATNRWTLSWDTFEYAFRNGKAVDVQAGTLNADNGTGKYFVFLDIPVNLWNTQNAINLQGTSLMWSKNLVDEYGNNALYKLRMGFVNILSTSRSILPELGFYESATYTFNASHINAGTITGDLIASGAIITRYLEAGNAVTADKVATNAIQADKIAGLGGFVARSSTSSTGTSDPLQLI